MLPNQLHRSRGSRNRSETTPFDQRVDPLGARRQSRLECLKFPLRRCQNKSRHEIVRAERGKWAAQRLVLITGTALACMSLTSERFGLEAPKSWISLVCRFTDSIANATDTELLTSAFRLELTKLRFLGVV